MARSADDLEVALQAMAGPDPQEAVGWRLELPAAPRRRLSDFKVGVMLTDPNCAQDDALTGQLQNTVDALARAGVTVVDGARPAIDTVDAFRTYLLLLRSATGAHATAEELAAHAARAAAADPDDWSYRTVVDRGVALSHHDWLGLNEKRYRMMEAWDAWFGEYDLLPARSPPRPLFPMTRRATRRPDHPDQWRAPAGDRPIVLGRLSEHGLFAVDGGAGRAGRRWLAVWPADCRQALSRSFGDPFRAPDGRRGRRLSKPRRATDGGRPGARTARFLAGRTPFFMAG